MLLIRDVGSLWQPTKALDPSFVNVADARALNMGKNKRGRLF